MYRQAWNKVVIYLYIFFFVFYKIIDLRRVAKANLSLVTVMFSAQVMTTT